MLKELQEFYGGLFEPELLAEINEVGIVREVPEGTTLMEIGQYIRSMPLLLSGVIKVLREDDNGDELLLYFLEIGDTCAMTMTCCMGDTMSEIKAITETEVKLVMIPVNNMERWTEKYKSWRNFVFESYHNRLMELLQTVDSIAFLNMDDRLLQYLKNKVKVTHSNRIQTTHQEIAYDLNTSRVVVSRLLKKLEIMNIISLGRNSIDILTEI
ncbi:Crp/Fnr family transcriptional regulator [Flavimarina sp. Hel_I_48]|uniref:Crp/Fnr family transcriptional regulator n=1 Tax=Flavimarina sp. Hel_I_48 TaxID=1392488 RepID=UPI0004DF5FC3|nr:Crp/Fnr family transcriptional regulator [Flavimarina sp. Hel_I_48]